MKWFPDLKLQTGLIMGTSEIDKMNTRIYETKKFLDNVTIEQDYDGSYEINCKRGLWGVYSHDKDTALNEAGHYFLQYLQDGEYGA